MQERNCKKPQLFLCSFIRYLPARNRQDGLSLNKLPSMTTGLIRQLKKLNKRATVPPSEGKQASGNSIAIFALVVSLSSLYLQFFYEKFDSVASLVDADIYKDTISLDIVYHNKGNQDATILGSEIFFYSDSNKSQEKNHIQFINDKKEPYVLSAGKQIFEKHIQKVYFNERRLLEGSHTSNKDTIRMNLRVRYLNENSLQSDKVVEFGWLTLDSLNKIDYWYVKYQKTSLDSDEYFSSGYSSQQDK